MSQSQQKTKDRTCPKCGAKEGGWCVYPGACGCWFWVDPEVDAKRERVKASIRERQVGGDHYKKLAIQPMEYILANKLGFVEGSVVKYVTRWPDKGGIEDLKKARDNLIWLIEDLEKKSVG